MVPERVRREVAGAHTGRDHTIVAREAGELLLGAIVTADERSWPVTVFLAERWRVEPKEIVVAALEAGQSVTLRPEGEGVWRTTAAAQIPLLLRARAVPSEVELQGDPVLLAPTSRTAFLVGSDDLDGLTRAVTSATQALREHPLEVVSARALVRRSGWEPFAWPEESGVRWRDRRAAARVADAVQRWEDEFSAACEQVRDHVRREGLPIRRYLGSTTTDEKVLEGWGRLATAFGLDDREAADVQAAAADSLRYFDAHEVALQDSLLLVDRDDFRVDHALLAALLRRGSVITVNRKSQLEGVVMMVAQSPAARAAGARITLADDYDGALELAEDVAARLAPQDVDVVSLGDGGSDLNLVLFPAAARDEVYRAERLIGDIMLLSHL